MKLFEVMQHNALSVAGGARVTWETVMSARDYMLECAARFYNHDYGTITPEDAAANEAELTAGTGRIIGRYEAAHGLSEDIFIIAYFSDQEPGIDYNYTTILYKSDY